MCNVTIYHLSVIVNVWLLTSAIFKKGFDRGFTIQWVMADIFYLQAFPTQLCSHFEG